MIGQFGTSLNNPPQRYLVEEGQNGRNWWRLYSDNWLEQGGAYERDSAGGDWSVSLNFNKPFGSGNITIMATDLGTNSNSYARACSIRDLTATSFTIVTSSSWARDTNSKWVNWVAYGWGA